MTFVRTLPKIGLEDLHWAGEKAARLGTLIHAQFDVPEGFAIGAPAYDLHINENQIAGRLRSRLAEIEIEDPVELEAAAEEIRTSIEQAPLPASVESEINSALDMLMGDTFAVRVSRVMEDVVNPRASGIEQAFLGVRHGQVLQHVRRTWATLWTSRAMYYRYQKKIPLERVSIAVIVQVMGPSTAAGVLFTANPLTGSADQIHIDATYGLGEAIVAARWKPDHYVVNKRNLEIAERNIVNKPLAVMIASAGGIEVSSVAIAQQSAACLDDNQLRALASLSTKIEELFKQSQDIEWCIESDRIRVLQTRPLRK